MRRSTSSRRAWCAGLVMLAVAVGFPAPAAAAPRVPANHDEATIVRDEFGRPHIFAETNSALFEAYGFAVAQDRLWQLELNRRAARGRLAELFGPSALSADRFVRTVGYTDAELDAQFARLGDEEQEIFEAYRDGINRYLKEVVARDPLHKLPFEFHHLGIGVPAPWEIRDSVAFGAFMTRRFGEIGGRELVNQALLGDLIGRLGPTAGYEVFNDVRWINDPDAPVTVPPSGAPLARAAAKAARAFRPAQLAGASQPWDDLEAEAKAVWERLGIVAKLGSYAWVVSPAKTADRSAMLYGGPQMGFSAPEVLHEVQLTGGEGFQVTGMAFAGVPAVLIGRNDQIAWTSTTATGDNVDTYLETLCQEGSGYVFKGECLPLETRMETIEVRGAPPVKLTVLRTIHGPVIGQSGPFAASQKRAHWHREIESISPFLAFDRAQSVQEFEAAVRQIVTSHNFLYADRQGNSAYWQAGQVPVRPDGFDARLPFSGDGSAEWPGGLMPMPKAINPAQGFLANWNNKPSVEYDNGDSQIFGKQFRLWDLQDRLAVRHLLTLEEMRDIPKDIARFGGLGRESRFLRPYLLAALDAVPPSHPLAGRARAILEAWDGNVIANAVTSTKQEAGDTIFSKWLAQMIVNTFRPALGSKVSEASTNMLLHVLDDALGDGSGVPPSRDYFDGADPQAAIAAAFDQALAALQKQFGDDPSRWTPPRPSTDFNHPVVGLVGRIPASNRATYAQIVVLNKDRIHSENIFTLGQSGFIERVSATEFKLDPHFRDQLDLYRNFEYKPMSLLEEED